MPSLTQSGTLTFNGDSSATIEASEAAVMAASEVNALLDETQSWVAFRIKPSWASTDEPLGATNDPTLFNWRLDATNEIRIAYDTTPDAWYTQREATTEVIATAPSVAHAAGDTLTIVAAWTATQIKVSRNGAAFTTAASTAIPDLSGRAGTFGNREDLLRSILGDFYWCAGGTGTLSDADAATIHGFGNVDTALSNFPGSATFIWPATSLDYVVVDAEAGGYVALFDPELNPKAWF